MCEATAKKASSCTYAPHEHHTLERADRTRPHTGPTKALPSPPDPSGHSESIGGAGAAGNAVRSDGHDGDAHTYARQEHNTLERVDRTRPHPGTAPYLPSPLDPSGHSESNGGAKAAALQKRLHAAEAEHAEALARWMDLDARKDG